MKITIATGLYPPEIGGPATYTKMLEDELSPRGFNIKVVPFSLVRHYPKIVRHFIYAWKLWRDSKGSQLIYALDPASVGLPALSVARLRRLPFLLRVPGDYAWEQGQYRFGVTDRLHDFIEKRYSYGLRVSLLCRLESFVATRAAHVIVPSNYMKSVMTKWGVSEEKIQTIYSALHPLPVTGSRDQLRSQVDYTYPTIVSAGRLVSNKGFLELLEVFANLKQKYPEARLIIIGDGPQKEKLLKKAKSLGLTDSLRLPGKLSKEAMGEIIRIGDVFVLNTAHEGLSHQLIEVMDAGTPIVTTDVGGNPELITDGVEGFLVEYNGLPELNSAIDRILTNSDLRERMVQLARARSKLFTRDKVVEEVESVLRKYEKK